MKKIRILLSGKTNLQYYTDAMKELGVDAFAQYLPEVNTDYDGLVLCGGGDIDPKYYGEETDGSNNIDVERDEAEFALLKVYVEADKPVLGICRGHQLINVFFGGSLYQHLPESDLHTQCKDGDSVHDVTATPDSVLGKLYGTAFAVNSSHHQAVKELGNNLRATVFWNEKYVEAIEHVSLPIIGVQWHPERMCFGKKREDTVCGSLILKHFIDTCMENKG